MALYEYFGVGSIHTLQGILKKENPISIFLVTGEHSYEVSGAAKTIEPLLSFFNVIRFCNTNRYSSLEEMERGITLFKKQSIDLVIAVGGGTVIDTAKAIALLGMQQQNPKMYVLKGKEFAKPAPTIVAIPTTAGSGSESTSSAAIYYEKTKYAISHDSLLPLYSIIDPELTYTLPDSITATTGIGTLGQGIESYWSVYATEGSKKIAADVIRLVMNNLLQVVHSPDPDSKIAMSRAAHLAGKATSISRTALCHALAHTMMLRFNVPYGNAVGLTLAPMFIYNSSQAHAVNDKRGEKYAEKTMHELIACIGSLNAKHAAKKLTALMKSSNVATTLCEVEIKSKKQKDSIVQYGFDTERAQNNLRVIKQNDVRSMLDTL